MNSWGRSNQCSSRNVGPEPLNDHEVTQRPGTGVENLIPVDKIPYWSESPVQDEDIEVVVESKVDPQQTLVVVFETEILVGVHFEANFLRVGARFLPKV